MSSEKKQKKNKKKNTQKKKKGLGVVLVIMIVILVLLLGAIGYLLYMFGSGSTAISNGNSGSSSAESTSSSSESFPFQFMGESSQNESSGGEEKTEEKAVLSVQSDALMSSSAYMFRVGDGAVVLDKNSTEKIYPASLTKMMTVLVAVENLKDLNQQVTVTQEDIDPGFLADATQAGFSAGETVTVKDLLYGAMLPSGADACFALADTVAGGEAAFVEMMNAKAAELGMTGTHFVTCTGLHNDDHYTTVADLAILLKYALQNETYREIFTTLQYTSSVTSAHPEGISMESRVAVSMDHALDLANGVHILGGKTGFTNDAGFCMASIAEDASGDEYVLITAHAFSPTDEEGNAVYPYPNGTDAKYLYEQLPGSSESDTASSSAEEAAESASVAGNS